MKTIICVLLLSLASYVSADVLIVNIWKSAPGKIQTTIQNGQQAREIHKALGVTATLGVDQKGRVHYALGFKNWSEWVQFRNKLDKSKEWGALIAKINQDPSAELEDNYLLNSLGGDPVGGMYQVFIWDPVLGRGEDLAQAANKAKAIHEKAGASVGIHFDLLNRMHYVISFDSWEAWGKFNDTPLPEFQAFMQEQNKNPTAKLVKTYTATSL